MRWIGSTTIHEQYDDGQGPVLRSIHIIRHVTDRLRRVKSQHSSHFTSVLPASSENEFPIKECRHFHGRNLPWLLFCWTRKRKGKKKQREYVGEKWSERGRIKINILNSCPTQGRVEGWDAMKPLHYRSVSSKGAGRPRLTHHHKGGWNETKWMRWVLRNGGMKLVVGENGRNPVKNLPRPRFVHHETNMEGPRRGTPAVGGERLTACATRPPSFE